MCPVQCRQLGFHVHPLHFVGAWGLYFDDMLLSQHTEEVDALAAKERSVNGPRPLAPTCCQCGDAAPGSWWGMGKFRCAPCSSVFKREITAKRNAEWAAARAAPCDECGKPVGDSSSEFCQDCCDELVGHDRDPDEGMMCLHCNAEWEGP